MVLKYILITSSPIEPCSAKLIHFIPFEPNLRIIYWNIVFIISHKTWVNELIQAISETPNQTKFTHFFISSFQVCPGRQNFEGSVPLLGHSGFSLPKTDEEKTIINTEVATNRII